MTEISESAATTIEHRTRKGLLALTVLSISLVAASAWLPAGLPVLLLLIAGILLTVLTGLWQLATSTRWRTFAAFIGALLLLTWGVSTAGQGIDYLYSHKTHGGNMDFGTTGDWYRAAAVGLLVSIGSLAVAWRATSWIGQEPERSVRPQTRHFG